MEKLLARVTPGQVSWLAKVFALLVAFGLTSGYVTATLTVQTAGIGAFFLSIGLLLALPGQRSSELLGALAVWMTYAEFMSAIQCGQFDLWRWGVSLATLSLVVLPIKVQHLRQLARSNPYQPIRDLDRRIWSAAGSGAGFGGGFGGGFGAGPAPYLPAALTKVRIDGVAPEQDSVTGNA
ncbi:MAG: hypothetical protein ACKVOL_13570 [Novosphingobium sp.]